MASFQDIADWKGRVFSGSNDDICDGLRISGPTAELIATTLLDLLRYHYPKTDGVSCFQPSHGVECSIQGMGAFIQPFHTIEM
jgi:hypothetical protein